ncbi:uncharacterized protein BO80DRAFT_246293 [Aspergillus ibericus CBS 121593]|uniref:Uncharacterized protein n=1 Tax=Aspergillus ibericus CBS 121593 TaxID=1448316 RepID=A0A395GPE0_9EURO|nr:hypothetical protein BO80DRAFT_246293 [Aspergillus ibericus CBS 121593]RAK95893.1 hypothetical protein BO80DRAFT_246293 [Aspergillus ibericus CBS 121593]
MVHSFYDITLETPHTSIPITTIPLIATHPPILATPGPLRIRRPTFRRRAIPRAADRAAPARDTVRCVGAVRSGWLVTLLGGREGWRYGLTVDGETGGCGYAGRDGGCGRGVEGCGGAEVVGGAGGEGAAGGVGGGCGECGGGGRTS